MKKYANFGAWKIEERSFMALSLAIDLKVYYVLYHLIMLLKDVKRAEVII